MYIYIHPIYIYRPAKINSCSLHASHSTPTGRVRIFAEHSTEEVLVKNSLLKNLSLRG